MSPQVASPTYDKNNLPLCSREDCPSFDGKRCRLLGFSPDRFCEPVLIDIVNDLGRLRLEQRLQQHSKDVFDEALRRSGIDPETGDVLP